MINSSLKRSLWPLKFDYDFWKLKFFFLRKLRVVLIFIKKVPPLFLYSYLGYNLLFNIKFRKFSDKI